MTYWGPAEIMTPVTFDILMKVRSVKLGLCLEETGLLGASHPRISVYNVLIQIYFRSNLLTETFRPFARYFTQKKLPVVSNPRKIWNFQLNDTKVLLHLILEDTSRKHQKKGDHRDKEHTKKKKHKDRERSYERDRNRSCNREKDRYRKSKEKLSDNDRYKVVYFIKQLSFD